MRSLLYTACLAAAFSGCQESVSRRDAAAPSEATTAESLPAQLSIGLGQNPAPKEILDLVSELAEIDAEDCGRYNRDKQRRWEATFERLRNAPHATAQTMVHMLSAADPYARACGADVLCMAEEERALHALTTTLRDDDDVVRSCAALALGRIGTQRAVSSLIEAMDDEHHGVRRQVATALGQIASPKATSTLISAIKDKGDGRSCDVYTPMAIVAMWQGTHPGTYDEPASWALTQIGPPAVPELVTALEDPNGENHAYIAWSLIQIATTHEDHDAIQALIAAKDHFDHRVRELIAEALKQIDAGDTPKPTSNVTNR